MKNSYYFPHDYHARHDPKLERLRMEIGPISDGIFWDLVEMLYEENGHLSVGDIPLYAKMLNTNEQVLNKVVTELFLIDGDKFYNQSLLDRLEHINNVIEKRRQAGEQSGKARQRNKCSTSAKHLSNTINKINKRDKEKLKPFLDFKYLEATNIKALLKTFGNKDAVMTHLEGMGFYERRIVEAFEKAGVYDK